MLWKKIVMTIDISPEIGLVRRSTDDLDGLKKTEDAKDDMIAQGKEITIDTIKDLATMTISVGEIQEERELARIDQECPFVRRCHSMVMNAIGPHL
jgi:hypothetical protein